MFTYRKCKWMCLSIQHCCCNLNTRKESTQEDVVKRESQVKSNMALLLVSCISFLEGYSPIGATQI